MLRERHGAGFDAFVADKVVALAGDVMREGFGVDAATLRDLRLADELNVIVNGAATTNFYERYCTIYCLIRQRKIQRGERACLHLLLQSTEFINGLRT